MTPQEKFNEIKKEATEATRAPYCIYIDGSDVDWLIARVEQLEKALKWYVENEGTCETFQLLPDAPGELALNTGPKPD